MIKLSEIGLDIHDKALQKLEPAHVYNEHTFYYPFNAYYHLSLRLSATKSKYNTNQKHFSKST